MVPTATIYRFNVHIQHATHAKKFFLSIYTYQKYPTYKDLLKRLEPRLLDDVMLYRFILTAENGVQWSVYDDTTLKRGLSRFRKLDLIALHPSHDLKRSVTTWLSADGHRAFPSAQEERSDHEHGLVPPANRKDSGIAWSSCSKEEDVDRRFSSPSFLPPSPPGSAAPSSCALTETYLPPSPRSMTSQEDSPRWRAKQPQVYACVHRKHDGSVCGQTFQRPYDLTRHQTMHMNNRPYVYCQACGKRFTRLDALRRHERVQGHVPSSPPSSLATSLPSPSRLPPLPAYPIQYHWT